MNFGLFLKKKQHEWNPPWKTADEVFSEDFGKLLIKDLKYLRYHPEKWERYAFNDADLGIAENLTSGQPYQGKNQTLLKMHTSLHQSGSHKYTMPVYVTEKQLKYAYPKAKIVDKNDKAHVTYYKTIYKDKNGNSISESQYKALSPAERKTVNVSKSEQTAEVYNIDNTDLENIYPRVYDRLKQKFAQQAANRLKFVDASGMYTNPVVEKVSESWQCAVLEESTAQGAFYDPSANCVVLPSKERFMTGNTFVTGNISQEESLKLNGYRRICVLIHECMHSTGPKFGRQFGKKFGDPKYAREELVAETGAMMTCALLGLPPRILRNSERYLDTWLDHNLLKDPNFFKSVLEDARKASKEFINEYNIQAQKLGQPTIKIPPDSAGTKKKPLIKRVLAGIGNLTQRFVNMFGHHGGRNQRSSPDKATETSEKMPEAALNAPGTRDSSMEKEVPAANARETGAAEQTEASASAERTTGLAGTNRNGKADTGVSQLSPEDAEDRRIEQLIAQKCPTASRDNIEHIRNIIKQRLKAAKQQGGGLRIVDGKAQSLNERTNAHEKEQDRGPRTASRI
ncbi:MAG: DUF1738 domain-containing protein [Succinivibrionaceae bacterium]|nr:DUF1738 domain-containing protein [Succinivibrionaceae bacterium]